MSAESDKIIEQIKPRVELMVRRWKSGGQVGGQGNLNDIRFIATELGILPRPAPVTQAEVDAALEAFRAETNMTPSFADSWKSGIIAALAAAKGVTS